jgi:hypothetical protein
MAFTPHNLPDAQWGSYIQVPITDTDYPAATARETDTPMFNGAAVVTDTVSFRYAQIVEDRRLFSSSSTSTAATATTSPATLLSATPNRKGFKISNTGGNAIYVLEGSGTPSATNHTATIHAVPSDADNVGYYESKNPVWTGEVNIVSASGSVTLVVTEYT